MSLTSGSSDNSDVIAIAVARVIIGVVTISWVFLHIYWRNVDLVELDTAIRKALVPHFPQLSEVHLVDYKVRIVDAHRGTAARPRVLIESRRGEDRWSTVGCSENIIQASWQALWDSFELPLAREQNALAAAATPRLAAN